MRLAERRAMLYSPDFWRMLSRQIPPFADEQERRDARGARKINKGFH